MGSAWNLSQRQVQDTWFLGLYCGRGNFQRFDSEWNLSQRLCSRSRKESNFAEGSLSNTRRRPSTCCGVVSRSRAQGRTQDRVAGGASLQIPVHQTPTRAKGLASHPNSTSLTRARNPKIPQDRAKGRASHRVRKLNLGRPQHQTHIIDDKILAPPRVQLVSDQGLAQPCAVSVFESEGLGSWGRLKLVIYGAHSHVFPPICLGLQAWGWTVYLGTSASWATSPIDYFFSVRVYRQCTLAHVPPELMCAPSPR